MFLAIGYQRSLPISCKMSFMCKERDILHTQGTGLHTPRMIGVFDSSRIIEDTLVEALYPNYG